MSSKWTQSTWGEIATLEYGKSLRGYNNVTGKYRVFGTNGPIGWHTDPLCPFPGVIIGRKGAYRGVHFSSAPFFVIDTAFYLKPKVGLDIRWAYYQLLTQDINGMDNGSAIPSTSREEFYRLPVVVPPLEEQQEIAKTLSLFDGKIEFLREQNKTLEAVAQALYKRWFVDFEFPNEEGKPYKSSGGKMVESELVDIPVGWRVVRITELFDFIKGIEPGSSNYAKYKMSDNYIPFYRVQNISGNNNMPDIFIEKSLSNEKIFEENDILVSLDGTIGKVFIGGSGSYSSGIRKVISKKESVKSSV
ncbi:MAG: restriction endonuclease subunit S [bacterium]